MPSELADVGRRVPGRSIAQLVTRSGIVLAGLLGAILLPFAALWTDRLVVAVGVVVAGLFILLTGFRPDLLVAAVLVLSITTLTSGFPLGIDLGGLRVTLFDVLLLVAVISACQARPPYRIGPLLWLVAAAAAWGVGFGIARGAPLDVLIDELRSVLYLLAGLGLGRRVTSEQLVDRGGRLAAVILWSSLAVLLAGMLFGLPIAASEGQAHLAQGAGTAGTSAVEFAATRYVSTATHLALLVLAGLTCYVALPPGRRQVRARPLATIALFVPALFLVVLSYSRNTLLGLVAAVVYTALATRSFRSLLSLAVKSLAALSVVVLVGLALFPASTQSVGAAYLGRVLVGTSLEALEADPGIQFRAVEVEYALGSVREQPLFGVGFGTAYRPALVHDPFPADAADYARSYAHNWYLWLAVKVGLLGAVPLFWLLGTALGRGVTGPPSSAILASGLAAILAASFVWATLRAAGMALAVGLIAGCVLHGGAERAPTARRVAGSSGPSGRTSSRVTLTGDGGVLA